MLVTAIACPASECRDISNLKKKDPAASKNLSPYFALRHDRIQDDFTLYIYTALNTVEL